MLLDHVLTKNLDTCRHELPVTAAPIEVLVETPDVVVVNKPSSIPIHPCGRYRHNSLVYIMAKELDMHNLRRTSTTQAALRYLIKN